MDCRAWIAVALVCGAAATSPVAAAETPRPLTAATPRIVNGVTTFGFPSSAVLLDGGFSDFFPYCSGTLIGCSTVLTAAHCFCNDGPCTPSAANEFVFLQHGGRISVASIAVNPDFEFAVSGDLAILRLATPVTGVAPSPINTAGRVAAGTAATIVGFGTTGGNANTGGIKREGRVTTAACDEGIPGSDHLCWLFEAPIGAPGQDSNSCEGDSGGPLFVQQGGATVLAGTTSGGFSANCLAPDLSFDADVFVERAWIAATAGADLGTASCGGLPAAGTAAAPVFVGEGELDFDDEEDRYFVDVPAGTAHVRFALNHDDTGGFGLYVRRDLQPVPPFADCLAGGRGFDACEFPSPAAGRYNVLVDRLTGSGRYQVTATVFAGGPPDTSPCVRDADTACLLDGRFEVQVTWTTAGGTGAGQAMAFGSERAESDQSIFFWFFNPANFEMGVKMVDACDGFDKFWVFVSGLTNQGFEVRVRDTETGAVRRYPNALGSFPTTVGDTSAFACP